MPNNYVLLDRIELNANAASVTFDNIPQSGYTDLLLVSSARSATGSGNWDGVYVSFNATSVTTNHSARRLYGFSSTAASDSSLPYAGIIPSNATTANTFGSASMYIPNYRGSTNKSISVDASTENNSVNAINFLTAGLWANTAAITSITLTTESSSNFLANSTFSLYGLAQVGTTPAIAPKADGGNVIGTDGTYWYHAFLSNGTFTPQTNLNCDVLVVAGGGAGSGRTSDSGGGGGAGGLRIFTSQSLSISNFAVAVGAGGAALKQVNPTTIGASGVNSTFGALAAATGGGAGGAGGINALSGGSGGGAGQYSSSLGTGTAGQGNNGGSQPIGGSPYPSAGGGGAGAVGANGSAGGGGNGGAGVNTYSSWATATATGVSGFYAGGGGGGTYSGTAGTGGSGGAGSGGVGTSNGAGGDATANTGSGGGGTGGAGSGTIVNGNGGSGIVIIRYPIAS